MISEQPKAAQPKLIYGFQPTPGKVEQHSVSLTELLYLRATGSLSYTLIYFATPKRPELVTHPLSWFNKQNLPGLLRIHRKYIVSQLQISKIVYIGGERNDYGTRGKLPNGNYKRKRNFSVEVELFDKTRLPVAYRNVQPLLKIFGLCTASFADVPTERTYSVNKV